MGSSVMDLPDNITPRHQSIPLFTTTSFNGTMDSISGSEEFEYKPKRFTMPAPSSPGRRGYKKPSKPREFAKSAKKRQSVLALGSITHLQHFYAKRGIIIKPKKPKRVEEAEKKMNLSINTNITDLLKVTEEPDDFPPTPLPPSPPPLPAYITSKLDKEVDPEVLLATCHKDIQAMIEVWCMVTGEVKSEENPVPVDILAAIETTTKTVQSVKNYSMSKQDLSPETLSKIRSAALEVLEMVSDLEQSHRDDDTDDSSSEDGHIYKESNYRSLDKQRVILRKYLEVVEESLLFDDTDIYPPNTSYLRPSSISSEEDLKQPPAIITPPLSPGHPNNDWVNPDVFGDDVLARYHAFLEAHRPSKSKRAFDYTPLPDPCVDKTEFLASLSDGKLLCTIYNTIVRRSKRPFGFIDKIHEDTSRTYRATENLKFFAAAAKFRFDLKFDEFNVTEIVKLTNTGKSQLERILEVFCEAAMQELISTGCYRQYPSSRVTSMYLQDSLSNSQMQLLQQATTNDLAAALSEKLSIHRSSTPSSPTLSRKSSHESS